MKSTESQRTTLKLARMEFVTNKPVNSYLLFMVRVEEGKIQKIRLFQYCLRELVPSTERHA
jgi:hypothetical protein